MPTPPGFADISMQLTLASFPRPAYVTFGADPTTTDPSSIATSVAAAFASPGSLFTRMDSSVILTGVRVALGTDGGEDLIGFTASNVACTAAGSGPPPNVAILVHKRTARGGRRGRGRMFLPWFGSEGDHDETGSINSTALGQYQTAVDAFKSNLLSLVGPMVVLHGPGETTPGPPDLVTALEVDRLVSTQRRRLGR
jgi:hypothetical protein